MSARWEAALDAQLDFVSALGSNDNARRQVRYWAEAEREKKRNFFSNGTIESLPDRLAAMAYNAETVYVDPDMMTIWEGSLAGFQPEPLVPQDLVTPAGFLWLPRPFYTKDIHGKSISTRAILWHPQSVTYDLNALSPEKLAKVNGIPGVMSISQGDIAVPVQKESKSGQFSADGILFTGLHWSADKDDYTDARAPGGWYVHYMMPWGYGAKFKRDEGIQLDQSCEAWQALWRLMQQTLAMRTKQRPDRATRKRLARAKWPEREVTVVQLRRPEPAREKGEPQIVNWTHRWLVGGHWRMQPYPSIGLTRQIWISPYVKGPAELPLEAAKGRVFELIR